MRGHTMTAVRRRGRVVASLWMLALAASPWCSAALSISDVEIVVPAGSTAAVTGGPVHYLVAEQGVYTLAEHGVKMEAVTFTSTVTDRYRSWSGQLRSYQNSYSKPVVLGQVMTYNDPDWSAFWCRGSKSSAPPNGTLRVGKHVGQDPDTTRANETIGYVVIETGSGTVAVATQAAMDGTEGSWAVLYGASPLAATSLKLAAVEDQAGDSERNHTAEQVGYIVFE